MDSTRACAGTTSDKKLDERVVAEENLQPCRRVDCSSKKCRRGVREVLTSDQKLDRESSSFYKSSLPF